MTSPLNVSPAVVQWVTANLDTIGASLAQSHAAAAGPTTGVVAAAQDEVSAAIASLFSQHAEEYQGLAARIAAFHDQFTSTMAGSGAAYSGSEAANAAQMLKSAMASPAAEVNGGFAQATGRPLFGNGADGTQWAAGDGRRSRRVVVGQWR